MLPRQAPAAARLHVAASPARPPPHHAMRRCALATSSTASAGRALSLQTQMQPQMPRLPVPLLSSPPARLHPTRPASSPAPFAASSKPSQPKPFVSVSASQPSANVLSLFNGIIAGDRASLARAITLVESTRQDHKHEAQQLLSLILRTHGSHASSQPAAAGDMSFPTGFRIGLSGAPGVGKSSFIETFGMFLIEKGHRVAVLAVDPSSSRTGGSILGDKTRMPDLSRHASAYVRPSPSSGSLGGVARNTNEAIILCSAAGYDVILVETVGVGQSETMVADMVDMFALLVAPGGGDELQGMKKGIVELSDLIVVNKADGELANQAKMAQLEYTSALKFLQPMNDGWYPKVLPVSSHEKRGIDQVWDSMKEFYTILNDQGDFDAKRGSQQKKWMWRQITDELLWRLKTDPGVRDLVPRYERLVDDGLVTSGQAAEEILDTFIVHQQSRAAGATLAASASAAAR
ncbi:ArgK protein-domain-containing protein [Entophlyctis helioformis]|nr:ArgK protein-domain-containing protein [Entophlyctis helioformis]